MAKDAAYAAEIVRFARENADKPEHADLADWATKLELAVQKQTTPARAAVPPEPANSQAPEAAEPAKPSRYIWGIR
jgi:hypothetical protein